MSKTDIIKGRIASLREAMAAEGLDALIVPQVDPHGSEYVADRWQARKFFSGFTGSAGPLVLTKDSAWVIVDSRYWLQAADQLSGTGIGVVESGKPDAPSLEELLARSLQPGAKVGIDGLLISQKDYESLSAYLEGCGLSLVLTDDIPDKVWEGRSGLPGGEIFVHELKYAGEAAQAKLDAVRSMIVKIGVDSAFIGDLAQIAWLLNIRSTDVACNPVVIAYLYVSQSMAVLFVEESKLTDEVRAYLAYCGVTTAPYAVVDKFLVNLPEGEKVAVDFGSIAARLVYALGRGRAVASSLPINEAKAVRNQIQIEGTRRAMERDGAALVKGFMEIESRLRSGQSTTEIDVDAILTHHRSAQDLYFDLSFETIAGYGAHGAIVHYSATPETNIELRPEGLLLVDSGASYLDGTTDITRTIALGDPTDDMRRDYTAVLKGNVALARAVFPAGTRGAQLDVLARMPMWTLGANYLHGTGHGVGHFLNVHEGPQSIRMQENPQPLLAGMVTSDEPGIYRAGRYGIRIENLLLARHAFDDPDYGEFLSFETLTLYPFDRSLINRSMLDDGEKAWIDGYHAEVYRRLRPLLTEAEASWLEAKCAPLD